MLFVLTGVPGVIYGVDIDTSFFTGNYSPQASIQAACLESKFVDLVMFRKKIKNPAFFFMMIFYRVRPVHIFCCVKFICGLITDCFMGCHNNIVFLKKISLNP